MKECCLNCRFFDQQEDVKGDCRRYPPLPMVDPEDDNEIHAFFPEVYVTTWCGEWKPTSEAPGGQSPPA